MADLLIEIIGEEIPARMQAMAAQHFSKAVKATLDDLGVLGKAASVHGMCGPRHLAIYATDIAVTQQDHTLEKRGPRVDAAEQAISGFLASTGLTRDMLTQEDTPKGRFFFARKHMQGNKTQDLLAGCLINILTQFPWPKSQRWGRGQFRWVRPLHRINILFNGKPVDGVLELGNNQILTFGATSCGHYFEFPGNISLIGVASLGEFKNRLAAAHVIIDQQDRIAAIVDGAKELASSVSCVVDEIQLSADVQDIAGLVEMPTVLLGCIESRFMELPSELLQATISKHQKYITLINEHGVFSPYFIVVSNRQTNVMRDKVIMSGNQRVLRSRLSDAEFFWQQDQKKSLDEHLLGLQAVTFYEGLGNLYEKAKRLEKLAADISPFIAGCNQKNASRAGRFSKADLTTALVREYPDLQGIIGGYYARRHGENKDVVNAISVHYCPQGPADKVPVEATAKAVALADKIDTLVGFFGIGAKPTGSKDPLALRRAALGVIRIIVDGDLSLPLDSLLQKAAQYYGFAITDKGVLPFIRDRLRVYLREQNMRHDVVAAALVESGSDDLWLMADRARVLGAFLTDGNGASLMAGWRRVNSILSAEEKKENKKLDALTDQNLFNATEKSLYQALKKMPDSSAQFDFQLMALSQLGSSIDAFFDNVVVNDDNSEVRLNRLGLLAMVREKMLAIVDFAKIEG